jgi:GNAT superfamily N-acetyltransferase
MRLTFRRAVAADADRAVRLVLGRLTWLGGRGLDQWSTRDQGAAVRDSIAAGRTWVLCDGPQVVGTLALSTTADPDFWTEQDRAVPALYVTKMATALDQAGHGLGDLLLDCVAAHGRARGVSVLRWDAWRTNPELHRYYAALSGVRHVRTVPGLASGALFELASADRSPEDVDVVAPTMTWATLPTARGAPPGHVGDPGAAWLTVPDLTVCADPARPVCLLAGGRSAPVIWHAGDRWRIRDLMTQALNAPTTLAPGQPYNVCVSADETSLAVVGDPM